MDVPIINDIAPRSAGYDVPTLDDDVRASLRRLGLPEEVDGEDKAARRSRLMEAMKDDDVKKYVESDDEDEEDDDDDEEFYTPGSEALHHARLRILEYSTQQAKARLLQQRNAAQHQDFVKQLKHRRNINAQTHPQLVGSQLIPGNTRTISQVRYNTNSTQIACGSWDGNVYVIDSKELGLLHRTKPGYHTEKVSGLDWHQDLLVSGGNEGAINVWRPDAADSQLIIPVSNIKAHSHRITKTLFHPSGRYIASTSFDQTWKLFDVATEAELLEQEGHSKEVFAGAFHPDGSLFATGGLDAIGRVWDLRSGRSIATLEDHIKGIYTMDFSPNGYHLATGSGDCSVKMWDLRRLATSSKPVATIPAHTKLVSEVRFFRARGPSRFGPVTDENDANPSVLDANGSLLLTTSYDNTLALWLADNWTKVASLAGPTDKVMTGDINGDASAVVCGGWDRSIKLFE